MKMRKYIHKQCKVDRGLVNGGRYRANIEEIPPYCWLVTSCPHPKMPNKPGQYGKDI